MKKLNIISYIISVGLSFNIAFSSSHAKSLEIEFNKNNIYEEFTDEIDYPNSDEYFMSEELEPDLTIEDGEVEKIEKYIIIKKDEFGILTSNLKYPDEDYILENKVFNFTNIDDDLEPFNRRAYAFNTELDHYVYIPVTTAYKAIVPKPIRTGISNFFGNLSEITTTFNSILQLRPDKALNSLGRFTINSTVGIGGFFDVAKHAGLKNDPETFGDTMGVYGAKPGSYLVVPFTGPTTVRDGVGMIVDGYVSGAIQDKIFDNTLYKVAIEDSVFYPTKTTLQGLNARAIINFKYGDMNSPFEYDLARAFIFNYRQLQIKK